MSNNLLCGHSSHEDQRLSFPVGAIIETVSPVAHLGSAIPIGARGKITSHCDDGRAWILFDGYSDAGHTFHTPEHFIRVVELPSDDDECAFIHALPSGSVRCGALRRNHSQYTGHKFTEPTAPAPRAGEPDAAGIVSASALQLAQKVDQIYDTDLSNHLLTAVQAEHNQYATLIEQRERLVTVLRELLNRLYPHTCDRGPVCNKCKALLAGSKLLATIEREGEA